LFKVENNPNFNISRYHYERLYNKLKRGEIKYIAMQYPTRNINELKDIFEGNKDIIFVSNEENFKEALETNKYENYFIDKFAGDFGHFTPKSNRLIAENVANVILDELGIN